MSELTVAAVAAELRPPTSTTPFARIEALLDDARARGASLVVLPKPPSAGTSPT